MLPGWSSDPYVIVKLCEKKEELEKFQTKTVGNDPNPEFGGDAASFAPRRIRHAMPST